MFVDDGYEKEEDPISEPGLLSTVTFSSILTTEITEVTYTTIKGTVTMALDTSTVCRCTYVYDNSKCIGAERRGALLLLRPIYKLSISYKQLRHIENSIVLYKKEGNNGLNIVHRRIAPR